MSHSTFDLQTVFDTIAVNAVRLCAAHGRGARFDGELVISSPITISARGGRSPPAGSTTATTRQASGRAIVTRKVAEIEDMLADRHYTREVTVAGQWEHLAVPMLRDGAPIGAIVITRNEVGRFADRHIELLKTFADQAVIAVENVRLFETAQQRTRELSESLEQQTATSEVLKVISSSPGELEPVFRTMLENATNLWAAEFGNMYLRRGDAFELAATHNMLPDFAEERKRMPYHLDRGKSPSNQMVRTKSIIHVADLRSHDLYLSRDPRAVAGVELGGVRSLLWCPCSRKASWSATLRSIAKRSAPLPTSRSNCCRTSPPRP